MIKGVSIALLFMVLVFIGAVFVNDKNRESKPEPAYKPVNIDSIANVQHENFLKWMNLEFYALGKQQEFKGKMDISEVRYQVNGKKQDYRAYYKYRDSLIKWIKFKDSLDKTQK